MSGRRRSVRAFALLIALAVAVGASVAEASLRKEGSWPTTERTVSLELRGVPRGEAVKKLADQAGWSLVFASPPTDPIDVALKRQPADQVLEVLLANGNYVAHRQGTIVSISADAAPAAASAQPSVSPEASSSAPAPAASPPPPASASPPAAPEPPPTPDAKGERRGRDRQVTGGSLRIEKGETVHDVDVLGGSADIWGTVTGDVAVMGGAVRVHDGAVVRGDATAVGGSLVIEDGARVDGDTNAIGGVVKRGEHAIVGGSSKSIGKSHDDSDEEESRPGFLSRAARKVGSGITRTALLFVLGAILLALASPRMERLQVEIAGRPMRSFALGIVGALAAIVLFVALCVTVIGIPIAIVGFLLAGLGALAGMCAALQTLGRGVVGHRSSSIYVHLAAGCAVLLVIGLVPVIGKIAIAVTALVGFGSLVATRAAGLLAPRNAAPGSSL